MEGSPVDIVIFAPLAPILGVLLFWFIQLLSIESEKILLSKVRPKHEPLCRFTNFLGILFQSVCHALGYTITKSGISDFYISVNYGRVAPKKEKKGIFEWISNAFLFIGPFFLPAFLLLICLLFSPVNFEIITPSPLIELKYTFAGQIMTFGASLHAFAEGFFEFLFNIDLLHPGHFGFLLLLIFLGMGMRPSYIGEKKQEKVDMLYDLKNIWSLITHKPLYLIILFMVAYIFFYISLFFNGDWFVALFSILGWVSIISIVAIIIANILLFLIKTTDEIPGIWKFIPYLVMPISYISARILFFYVSIDYANFVSLLLMTILTAVVTLLLLKYKTNKFKSKRKIKMSKKKGKGETDEG
ncbi:MAG: hypothetical protein KAR55_01440 [Thermoplasmatales archaeon]|nr:hypothetical protein [Thermoplasmatales archaeon]